MNILLPIFGISFCSTSWSSCWPISPAGWGPPVRFIKSLLTSSLGSLGKIWLVVIKLFRITSWRFIFSLTIYVIMPWCIVGMKITRVVHSLCCRVVLSPDVQSERVWEDHQEKIAGSPTVLLESFPWYFTNITSKCQRYLGHECEVFNGSVIEQELCLPGYTD